MSGQAQDAVLDKIKTYSNEARRLQQQQLDVEYPDPAARKARFRRTSQALQEQLKRRQIEFEKIRASTGPASTAPSADVRQRIKQLRAITAAYTQLTAEAPDLPGPDSLLPAVLAARVVNETITQTKSAIETVVSQLESTEQQIEQEQTSLTDAKLLHEALEARITRLQAATRDKSQKTPDQLARELVKSKEKRETDFNRETERLRHALNEFIDSRLAAMVAAEDLGGPVVGDLLDISDEMLEAGFSNHGKVKASKRSGASAAQNQRRIDDMWSSRQDSSERDLAAKELQELLDELLANSGSSGTSDYVELDRDSAAARFMVRAKVAQFHPKDARRLRLIDFGRELDS
ncbi:hypothetical protein EJ06DRAFT_538147 [Trichodelitschia bisporula]|uniref:Uncharacterized protein n=1 Tax=Trichodelitschia bisporula TaxID=703511 RepID=A0A6G1HVY4_9PEZI|nr:hypothetical protein EJ06DRAFT_538147 [Trichodelitschia bisporula]